jgi:PKHD-type hydroxylase
MQKIWQMWSGRLEDQIVADIINICEKYPIQKSYMGYDNNILDNQYRTSEIRWVGHEENIKNLMFGFAQEANRNAFGFNIDCLTDIQFTTYKGSDNAKYDWHCDTFWGNPTSYDRKISVVVQLTDSEEYEGGDFQFVPEWEQPANSDLRRKGTVICFPSFIHHRVTPVTQGVRKSLVAWVEGPKFR